MRHSLKTATPLLALLLALALLAAACSDDGETDKDAAVADGAAADAAPPPKPVAMQELLDACVRASACGVKTYPILGNCIEAYHNLYLPQGISPIYDTIYKCVNAAKGDCSAVIKCFGKRSDCDNTYKDRCEGTVAVSCDLIAKTVYAVECADANMVCEIKQDGSRDSATCTPGKCYSTFGNSCSGSRKLNCTGGLTEVYECSVDELVCGSTSDSSGECIGATSSKCYVKKYTPTCKGTKRVTCVHGRESEYDCSKRKYIGTACKGADCAVAGTACDHSFNRCAGDELEVCLDGSWVKVNCKGLGLGGCQQQGIAFNCSKL